MAVITAYLLISFYFFINWLKFFNHAPSWSIEDRFLSVVILIVATILWPFVVPISFIDELLKARELRPEDKI